MFGVLVCSAGAGLCQLPKKRLEYRTDLVTLWHLISSGERDGISS